MPSSELGFAMLSAIFYWDYWGYRTALALILALPVSIFLFRRYKPVTKAAVLTLIGGAMFLPEQARFDFPLLPPLDKYTIGALCALLGAYMRAPQRLAAARFGRMPIDVLLLVMLLGGVGTFYTNQDALVYGNWKIIKLPPLALYDAASIALGDFMMVGLPFFLGRIFLRGSNDVKIFFVLFACAGVIYSLPILYEIRMSPLLHKQIYGFFARRDWLQNVRGDSYRPTVFMGHGLVVGFFICLSLISALSLRKAKRRSLFNIRIDVIIGFLAVILYLCKASGALLFAVASAPVLLRGSIKTQMRAAMLLSLIVLAYPILRTFDVFPTDTLVEWSNSFSEDRADSLRFRFDNEDVLAMKATERIWFGWGGYGRDRVYDENTAKDLTVQDGHWVIVFGQRGAVGFFCFYALLLIPVFLTALRMDQIPRQSDRALLAGFAFIISLCAVNTIPNMLLPIIPFFLAGGLMTLLSELPKETEEQRRHEAAEERQASRLSRAPAVSRP